MIRRPEVRKQKVTSVVVPCKKCHRPTLIRFSVVPVVDAKGKATMKVSWKADPHICPRPKNSPMPAQSVDPLRVMDDEAIAVVQSKMVA